MLVMNHATKQQLEQAIIRLGWERYEHDLWRHRKTGVIVGFMDAVVSELQTCNQATQPFQGRYFKQPDGTMEKSGWMDSLAHAVYSVLRRLRAWL